MRRAAGDAGGEEVRQVEQRAAAQGNVDGHIEPARRVGPQEPEQHAKDGPGPDQPEQQHRRGPLQQAPGQRCVAAGDDQHDVGVVQPFQHHLHARGPVAAVVDGADAEQQNAGEGVDGGRDLAVRRGCQDTSTMPAARASGAVTVWIQPRHLGLIVSSSAMRTAASSTGLGPVLRGARPARRGVALHASRITYGPVSYFRVTSMRVAAARARRFPAGVCTRRRPSDGSLGFALKSDSQEVR